MDPIEKLKTVADLLATAKKLAEPLSWSEASDLKNRLIRDRVKLLGKNFESMKVNELARVEFMTNEAKQRLGNLTAGELSRLFGVPFSDSSKKFHAVDLLAEIARGGPFTNFQIDELSLALDFYKKFAQDHNIPLSSDTPKLMAHVKGIAQDERKKAKERAAARKEERQRSTQKDVEDYYRNAAKDNLPQYEKVFGPNYAPHGEYAPPAIKSVKRGPEMDHEAADGRKGNPYYDTRFSTYTENCQTCVVIYEMRRRGYDVQALGYLEDKENPCYQLSKNFTAAWIDPATGLHPIPTFDSVVTNAKTCLNWLNRSVEDGNRYILYVAWKDRVTAHVVHVYKGSSGDAVIFDPQTGVLYETPRQIKHFLSRVYYDRSFSPQLLRCDNLLLNIPVIKKIAKQRNGVEPY